MRLRHGARQNAPARQQQQAQAQAKRRRQQQRRQYVERVAVLDPDDTRVILRQAAGITESPPKRLPKPPPKGAPVPRQLRWYRPTVATLYSDADINSAAGLLAEAHLADWRGPAQVGDALYGRVAKLTRVWRVKHRDERLQRICETIQTYDAAPNVQRVYHGTSGTSLAGIVTQGLICGRDGMFGGGIYLAPHFSKAYAHTGHGREHYVFLADVALGRPLTMEKADHSLGAEIWERGCHSVVGVRGLTTTFGDRTLQHDEFVVYYRDQVRLLYLAQFTEKAPVAPSTTSRP